jgi:phosphate transport system substrate-binding protein
MSQQREIPALILSLVATGGLLAAGYWWFTHRSPQSNPPIVSNSSPAPSLPSPPSTKAFDAPTSVPGGTSLKIDGSTSMAKINKNFKEAFERKFPGTQVLIDARGTDKGILDLVFGKIDIAASSAPPSPEEEKQGLIAVPVTPDAIAVMVGVNNPYTQGLTQAQLKGIFQGKITNWSELGGPNTPIRVLNRPAISGTHQVFQQLVLDGQPFGTSPNITTLERDATTPILQALGTDGISYATYSQVANQQTARYLPIDGLTPEAANYPYQRTLYYVYKDPPRPGVEAFLGFVTSPEGQAVPKQ